MRDPKFRIFCVCHLLVVPYTAVVRGHWCDATASGDKIAGRHFLAALHSSLEFYGKKEQKPILVLEEDRHI